MIKSRMVLLALCATLCVVTGHAESEIRTLASADTKSLADTSGFRPSFGMMSVSVYDTAQRVYGKPVDSIRLGCQRLPLIDFDQVNFFQ